MQYIVTADEMKEYDKNTIEKIGIPSLVLMERAALAVRDVILKECENGGKILIVAGVGNNGADGLALARLLRESNYDVEICVVGDTARATKEFRTQLSILEHYPVKMLEGVKAVNWLVTLSKLDENHYDVIVDAIFGVGLSREITGDYQNVLHSLGYLTGKKIAVDIPSGVSADNGKLLGDAFCADITVTFGFAKRGLYLYPGAEYAGDIRIADIGITERSFFGRLPEVFIHNTNDASWWLPYRNTGGNKGTFGKVLIIAGFDYMVGAAILCAKAALSMGAGMVKVLCPLENRAILQSCMPEVLYGTCEDLENSIKWADVIAIGPGLGKTEESESILKDVLRCAQLPLILDADALNMISETQGLKKLLTEYPGEKILTPHMGELSRICGEKIDYLKENILTVAKNLAKEYHCVMVCKDVRTVVAGEEENTYLNVIGNNGMATAGSGDVLTGMIAGVMAQERDNAFVSAVSGVFLHSLAGDIAKENHTEYAVTASKIIENIGNACKK